MHSLNNDLSNLDISEHDNSKEVVNDLYSISLILEEAKEASLFRLDETLSKIKENAKILMNTFCDKDFCMDYRMCDVDIPEMEVKPNEDFINQTINKFLVNLVKNHKTKFEVKMKEVNDEIEEKEIANKNVCEKEIITSPKPKKIKDEGGFVASMKRLWENKTPKLTSIWRKYDGNKSLNKCKLNIVKMEIINIIDSKDNMNNSENIYKSEQVSSVRDSSISVNNRDIEENKESFKSVNEEIISPRPTNVLSIGLSPLQSPPLLALTPSTPIPIVKTQVNNNSIPNVDTKANDTCKEEICINKENISESNTILRTSIEVNKENKNFGKSISNNNEDSPLPPRPIRRLTNEQSEKNIDKKFVGNYESELNLIDGDKTPVLSNNIEGTPKEVSNTEIADTGFVRPERISYVKKSGLRSILHHSANRFLLDHSNYQGSSNNDSNSNRVSLSHLVKTPINNKGFAKLEIDGKDKQKIGESPCRRYHKRLKTLPPINPDDSYVLTDSEDEKNNNNSIESKVTKVQKKIPLWARSVNWIPKIKEQRNVDPFSIFGDSCMFMDLEDVFQRPWYISTVARDNRIKSWQNDRLTSLNWSDDSLTSEELRQYKLKMNFYIDKSNEVYVTEPCFTPSPNPLLNGAWNHINKQRINSSGTTIIRKALNLSIHRFNNTNINKILTNPNKNLENIENNNTENIENFSQKPVNIKNISKEHLQDISQNSSFLQ